MTSSSKHKRLGRGRPKKQRDIMKSDGTPYWEREKYVTRVTNWRWRLAPFVKAKIEGQCSTCQMGGRCNRIPLNTKITDGILAGKQCPDYRSVWKKICGKEDEPYDWGF